MLAPVNGKLAGVMMTHLHLDHIMGMPDIANDGVPSFSVQ
jgi:phosphoribosyl 1,2-cyclic phosphodiesterase